MIRHGCFTLRPVAHPWIESLLDIACGLDDRMSHPKCAGCHRARPETCQGQLEALAVLGAAALDQRKDWK